MDAVQPAAELRSGNGAELPLPKRSDPWLKLPLTAIAAGSEQRRGRVQAV
jgi:hypothetical protein